MYGLSPISSRPSLFNFSDPFNDFPNLFNEFFGKNDIVNFQHMKTDIQETENSYVLSIELPGFKKEDVDISIKDNILTISAKREVEKKNEKDSNYIHCERSYGSFSRSFNVEATDTLNVSAKYDNGVLHLELPKKKKEDPVSSKIKIE